MLGQTGCDTYIQWLRYNTVISALQYGTLVLSIENHPLNKLSINTDTQYSTPWNTSSCFP